MTLDMNDTMESKELLKQIHEDLTGSKITENTPRSLSFIFCKATNETTADTLLQGFGIQYKKLDSIQDGIKEFQVTCDQATYERLFNKIVGDGLPLYISKTRLSIQGSIGAISVDATILQTKIASTDQTDANIKYIKVSNTGIVDVSVSNTPNVAITSSVGLVITPPAQALNGVVIADADGTVLGGNVPCKKIKIKTKTTATADADGYAIYIGDSEGQTYPLYAGESTEVEIDNLNKIYVKRAGASDNDVYYFAS